MDDLLAGPRLGGGRDGVDGEKSYYAYEHEPLGGFQRDKLLGGGPVADGAPLGRRSGRVLNVVPRSLFELGVGELCM